MLYTVDASVDEPIMLLMDGIGYNPETGKGIDGVLFNQELMYLDSLGKKVIKMWINCPGGSVVQGMNIYSAMMKSKTPVDTYCVGMAASMGAVIFQGGRKRIMADYGILMFHAPYAPDGETDQATLDMLAAMKVSCSTMISQRSGMTREAVDTLLSKDTFINAEDAERMKLCDRVEPSSEYNINYLRRETNVNNYAKKCTEIVNTLLSNDKNNTMSIDLSKVNMRLKLNDSAPAEHAIQEIDKIESRATTAEANITRLTNEATTITNTHTLALQAEAAKVTTAEGRATTAEAALAKVTAERDAMKLDKETAEKAEIKVKANAMVAGYAKIGRIKNDATTILKWETMAIEKGIDEIEAIIKDLPLSKTAPVIIEAKGKEVEGIYATTAVALMARNKAKRMGIEVAI